MISLKTLCDAYFTLFSIKDIEKISEFFSNDIELIDWNISAKGKENVLNELKNIFDNVKEIIINTQTHIANRRYYEDGDTVCCEIEIILDNKYNDKIRAIDVITFNEFMKIKKIKAYKI